MTAPAHQCGCEGIWSIAFTYEGRTYPESVSGYESDNPYLKNIGGKDYLYSACDDRDMRGGQVWVDVSGTAPIISTSFTKSDPNCDSNEPPSSNKYDCINGACLPSSTYNTPGIYESLSECEVNCGPGCSGVCISNQEWAQIEGLAAQLKSKNCS